MSPGRSILRMESDDLVQAAAKVSTSNQWTTLPGFIAKLNKKLPPSQHVQPKQLASELLAVPADTLAQQGIWLTSFGAKYMPIILTNPAYARAWRTALQKDVEATAECTCGAHASNGSEAVEAQVSSRYFGSQDYNAGRHAPTNSTHKANCLLWTPPSTGHLHSWRRGYDE